MSKRKQLIKYFMAAFMVIMLFICIWGIPLKEARIDVKTNGTSVNGTFTGKWSPVKGMEGMFIADDGWNFKGHINPDGGLWKGELTNFPIPAEWREGETSYLPEFYTGVVEDNVLVTSIK